MKATVVAALSVLTVLSADVGISPQVGIQYQTVSSADACGIADSCAIRSPAAAPSEPVRPSEIKATTIAVQPKARPVDANGNRAAGIVVSSKTGARARVGVAHAARFQAYIDDLENNHGARVLFMGGIRPGHCSPASEHPCGKALDVCQLSRGVVDRRCNLPNRVALGKIAASHGLFEGGRWCNHDYGHAQIDVTAAACSDRRVRLARQGESVGRAFQTDYGVRLARQGESVERTFHTD
jgi:hypothetical protein